MDIDEILEVRSRGTKRLGAVIAVVTTLWIISLLTYGFVGIASVVAESFSSMSLTERLATSLASLGFIATVYAGVARGLRSRKVLALMGALLLVVGTASYVLAHVVTLSNSPSAIEAVQLKHVINTTSSRLVPLRTAYAYAVSMLQTPTHTVYEDETYVYYDLGGHVVYNWLIEPEGFWNSIRWGPLGAVLVNGSVYPPKVYVIKENLAWGLHKLHLTPLFIDNLWREIKLRAGLGVRVLMDCNVEVVRNGEVYVIIPLETWATTLTTSVPVPAGFAVISPNGSIKLVSVEEARHDPLFRGVPIVSDVIAREWVEIYKYHTGFWNVVLYHNTYTIRDVGTNPQPYLMRNSEGNLYWVFVAEPPGATYSAKYIMYVNASNPKPHIMIYELPEPVVGISRIESMIKQAHPTYDWGEFSIEEPMPVIINGTLYWKVSVITKDGRGLVSIDLLNTATNEVRSIRPNGTITMDDVIAYLTGGTEVPKLVSKNAAISTIIEKVRELKKRIAQQEEELRKLYQELSTLEEMLKKVLTNQTLINASRR